MIKQTITKGIVLARTNYQEADRIITILTNDQGKIRVLAKGVRKSKSKLAGGVELFSVAEIGFLQGRGDLSTLTTSRLVTHYEKIVKDINRTMMGYEFIKIVNEVTEEAAGNEYFDLLNATLEALNNPDIDAEIVQLWFELKLLGISGHGLNVTSDQSGNKLKAEKTYMFDQESFAFIEHPEGNFNQGHIKVLRLVLTQTPEKLNNVEGIKSYLNSCIRLSHILRKHVFHSITGTQ